MRFKQELIDSLVDNTSKTSLKQLRKYILSAFSEGLNEVDPKILIQNAVKVENITSQEKKLKKKICISGYDNLKDVKIKEDINLYNSVLIIGGGKATAPMADALIKILGNSMDCYGLINIPHGQNWGDSIIYNAGNFKSKIEINYSAHPVPDISGINGTKMMIELVKNAKDEVLVFVLISGGGSALMPLPRVTSIMNQDLDLNLDNNLTLKDLQNVNTLLLKSGADINEINSVRKHLSEFKGGNLANYIYPKKGISLIISDVIGDKLDVIASGPTVPDSSTFGDAKKIIEKYNLMDKIGINALNIIDNGVNGKIQENPKEESDIFKQISNVIIGSAKHAKKSIIDFFKSNKIRPLSDFIEDTDLQLMDGEASEYGIGLSLLLMGLNDPTFIKEKMINNNNNNKDEMFDKNTTYYMISTGEFTVTINGTGKGGRNQEMLLSLLNHLDKNMHENDKTDLENIDFCIISMAFDGIEGNSLAAGAIIDSETISKINNQKLNTQDYLQNNNSFEFFNKINDSIIIGQTQTNINDICVMLIRFK